MVTSSPFSAQTILPFTTSVFSVGYNINSSTNTITTPRCALYWTHLELRTNATSMLADLSVISTNENIPPIGIIKSVTNASNYIQLSRQDLRWIPGGTQMYASSPSYGGQYWFWEGFDIASLMDPLIAFNVYNNSTITAPASPQPFPFTNVLVNEGGGWNSTSFKFSTPQSGTYVLSYSTACTANVITKFYLYLNNSLLLNAEVSDVGHYGIDMATRSIVTALSKDQSIWITGNGTQSYGNVYQLSSFKGFYVSPVHGIKCSWLIYSPTAGTAWTTLLNEGNIPITFDFSSAYVNIQISGIYYVSITTTNTNAANSAFFRLLINASASGTYTYPEIFTRQGPNGCATRSSSSLLRLFGNWNVTARNPSTSYQPFASYSGFLLYPL